MRYLLFMLSWLPAVVSGQPGFADPLPLADFDTLNWTSALRPDHPRLVLTPDRLRTLRQRIASESAFAAYYGGVRQLAEQLLATAPLERELTGRRLLSVSREALRRTTTLALVYLIEKDDRYLARLDQELRAVSAFRDWNPNHFLDVAEMSLAVALALDWCGDELPNTTRERAYSALYELGLKTSFAADYWWIDSEHNWNQVCHGGMVAAALTLAERHPEMAGRAIHRALQHIPSALRAYAPDGAYPEGPGYWAYGTAYSVVTTEMLQSALGRDFGIAAYPGFVGSGLFSRLMQSPSGRYFNYGDNRANAGAGAAELLAWFAINDRHPALYRPDQLSEVYRGNGKPSRLAPTALIWLAGFTGNAADELPVSWLGGGPNPVFTLRDAKDTSFFLAGKGGRGSINHGNLDAGSFVFDLDGVRWAHDLGTQSYNELEKIGFQLWGKDQQADRWKLISKNSYNHNTLTVNDSLHRVDGFATLERLADTTFRVDLTPVFAGLLASAERTFRKLGPRSFQVTDRISFLDSVTQTVSWRMLTTADVRLTETGAVLHEDGKRLELRISQPTGIRFSVFQLDPPPLPYDIQVPKLKRLQLDVPAHYFGAQPEITITFAG
jgi:hypothetical protein